MEFYTSIFTKTAQLNFAAKQYPPGTQGRPRSGVVRLSQGSTSQNGKPTTARLLSRLGTASLPESQIFINPARLNLNEYAELPHVAKPLFEYLYYVLGDVKKVSSKNRIAGGRCNGNL